MKTLVVIIVVCLPLMTFAQVEKGRSFISGGIGFTSNTPDNPQPGSTKKLNRFDVSAMYGFMVGDTWAIGISPMYQSQVQTFTDDSKNHSNSFGIGPFVRKYFSLNDKFYFHLDLAYGLTQQKDFTESTSGEKGPINKSSSNVFSLTPGASYFISDRVALQAMLGKLSYGKFKSPGDNNSSAFDVNFGISSFSLGAAVYF